MYICICIVKGFSCMRFMMYTGVCTRFLHRILDGYYRVYIHIALAYCGNCVQPRNSYLSRSRRVSVTSRFSTLCLDYGAYPLNTLIHFRCYTRPAKPSTRIKSNQHISRSRLRRRTLVPIKDF